MSGLRKSMFIMSQCFCHRQVNDVWSSFFPRSHCSVGAAGEGDAGDVLEVVDEGDIVPILQQRGDGVALAVADLEGEETVWFEGACRPGG